MGLKFHEAHPPSDDRTRCDPHKIFPGAHETSNDALKAEGSTQKKRYIGQEIATHNVIG